MDELEATPRARLRVSPDHASGGMVVCCSGELDLAGAADVREALEELLAAGGRPLVLDLTELRFLDSSGVAVLIRLANNFRPLRIRGAAPPVRRVIEVLGLADRLGLDGA